ncbi:ribonuclease P protein component [Gilvimarinus agarilyticus]|uniref:Ribonuclease P protein component n=1 Tax=Reichenbachiella agariperforans TaxID=156994 RepID=A0A1M6VX85_REIAG|nr:MULTISPECIES: ribonuclease P protein component [Reichenbachiella]MBU2885902.1 ribonuclease P protein component [Gilvimarinus agarilyticus]MBU2915285.1 ribonuclease P protein component [Reichenbachiella agariperforans]RJE70943.1 ribonuclease P protein component [Reichenbachiella sp. MSK19-1]SHK86069.1 ribonuclease P protein component [Reichenbachiella agariperforans]
MKEANDIVGKQGFSKQERLSSKKEIDALFTKGASFHLYPFSLKFLPQEKADASVHQILISVSKRRFKKAVDRNHIKRLIREAYRLNKHLISDLDPYLSIAYIYTAKEVQSFAFIQKKLIASLNRLLAKFEKEV